MREPSGDYLSRLQEYRQRLEGLVDQARGEIEQQAPEVLDRMAATARNIAQRLDEMAGDARQRRAQESGAPDPTPESAGAPERAPEPPREVPEPPREPPASPGGSGSGSST